MCKTRMYIYIYIYNQDESPLTDTDCRAKKSSLCGEKSCHWLVRSATKLSTCGELKSKKEERVVIGRRVVQRKFDLRGSYHDRKERSYSYLALAVWDENT